MLGRQQIAGIQNALTELFKNAHDAYADDVVVDYFEDAGAGGEGFIVIRDNGIGMTLNDFENKWLVLGTESKVGAAREQQFIPQGKTRRPITGEKGIGRLAIALLGGQVLVLSRAIRDGGLRDLVVSWIHWGLFEIPGLDLDEIDIPLITIKGGRLPSIEEITELQGQLVTCVQRIAETHSDSSLKRIRNEISGFIPDPAAMDCFFSLREENCLSLNNTGCGTHFFVGPVNPVLKLQIAAELKENDYSFRKHLLGFSDITFGEQHCSTIATSFKRWLPGEPYGEELLSPGAFFTREELLNKSDHFLGGSVDEYGQFHGSLRVYDKTYEDLIVPWPESNGKPTKCGPFMVNFGYIMGRKTESLLSPEEYEPLNSKSNFLGGMYVYRDKIRILPYGDFSHDWLDIEKRRNKGAGYYFFAHRRMFGAVQLTREDNHELQEKAGREGFQQNEAYRQLQSILINLLIYLAAEFFRSGGSNTDLFEQKQTDIRKRSEALMRQQKQALTKRKNLSSALNAFFHEVNAGLPHAAIGNLRKLTQSRMNAASKIQDQDKAATALIRAEQEALNALSELRGKYTVKRPAGIAFTKELSRDWDGYVFERSRLETELFNTFDEEVSQTLGSVAAQARIYVDQRKRLEERIKNIADERKRNLTEASKQANSTAADTRKTVFDITEKARFALERAINGIQSDLNRIDLNQLESEAIEEMRKKWEEELAEIESRHRDALMAARDMLASLAENLRASDGETPALMVEALEQRMLSLEEQAEEDFEMVQLGLAVAIINHEFAASIKSIRRSVQELGHLSRKSESLRPLYESIRTNFEHLDGHLNLFTPLQRRLHRKENKITGKSIRNYVCELFYNRFKRHDISLECTYEFLNSYIECYPSTLYPAFINIVDNAVFWLGTNKTNKIIKFDATHDSYFIMNNGPAIEERDRMNIMTRGFSRKPEGRGLGLFISSKALLAEKMKLTIDDERNGFQTVFRINLSKVVTKS
jgi:hypothetical protein